MLITGGGGYELPPLFDVARVWDLWRVGLTELEPGAEEAACGAAGGELVGAVGEVAGVDRGGVKVFDSAEGGEVGCDLGWGEEELEGLAGQGDA